MKHSKVRGAYCLGIFQNGKDATTLLGGISYLISLSIVGEAYFSYCSLLYVLSHSCFYCTGIIVRNTLVTYDRQHEMVGFWKTNCSDLWNRLNLSPPPPSPSGLVNTNSTGSMYPTLVPTGSPGYNASGTVYYYPLPIFYMPVNHSFSFSNYRVAYF